MSRISALSPEQATGKTKELFDVVKSKMGVVPNMMRVLGNSPAALNAYLGFSAALGAAAIGNKLSELIALAVASENGCNYCNAAHSFIGKKIGLSPQAIQDARHGSSSDERNNAALDFARNILANKGDVSEASVDAVKAAGYTEGEVIEIVAAVCLSIFTNYVNIVADTDVDFPKQETISNKASI